MGVAAAAVSHHLGPGGRSGGVTSLGLWGQAGTFADLGSDLPIPPTFGSNLGVFVQDDERLFTHPETPDDSTGLTVITRLGWAQPDRNQIPLYAGASVAWHGLGVRQDDTVGLGLGWLAVTRQLLGTPGRGSEVSVELFYKWRLSHFLSLQPDFQYYFHPGGDGRDALLAGARLKVKL
jgi:porin